MDFEFPRDLCALPPDQQRVLARDDGVPARGLGGEPFREVISLFGVMDGVVQPVGLDASPGAEVGSQRTWMLESDLSEVHRFPRSQLDGLLVPDEGELFC